MIPPSSPSGVPASGVLGGRADFALMLRWCGTDGRSGTRPRPRPARSRNHSFVSEGDLNTETGEISPDRGNHAIRVIRAGPTARIFKGEFGIQSLSGLCMVRAGGAGHLLPRR